MKGRTHAGVWFPPPLVFTLPLVAAAGLHAARPWPISDRYAFAIAAGGFIAIAVGIAIGLASVARFWKADTTILPAGVPTTAIVDSGPYRFTRNPMYLAMAFAYLGLAMLMNNVWALALLPGVVAAIDRFVIRREERYLAEEFGEAYRRYCLRVRRWI